LAQAFDLSFALVKRFTEMEDVSVGFLMQIDKLVHLLESPIFVHLRLKLLDVESKSHAPLLKSIYGILLCLPQGDAYRLLNNRLTTVCNLRDNLGLSPIPMILDDDETPQNNSSSGTSQYHQHKNPPTPKPLSNEKLLMRYDRVTAMHREARERAIHKQAMQEQQELKNARKLQAASLRAPEGSQQALIASGNLTPGVRSAAVTTPTMTQSKVEVASPLRRGQQMDYR
jgi:vacuole morphology and inheritance protein 14